MKIAILNMTQKGSTGKIMLQIARTAREYGHIVKTFSPMLYDEKCNYSTDLIDDHYFFGSVAENRIHCYLGIALGRNGFYSHKGTRDLVKQLEQFKPDIVHLHNLHKFCINLPQLFNYLKSSKVKVIWTLHDCWTFTGHCPYFTMAECEKWKSGCFKCSQIGIYPKSLIDNSKKMYQLKKKWFTSVEKLTIVTPSNWLAELVSQSFFQDYPVKVINNGIDLNVFNPTRNIFIKKYNIPDEKKILLGVAFGWGERKGLDVFIELYKRLDKNIYQLILVGTNEIIDEVLPKGIISIHKTENLKELAELYTSADLFVNPTREDNYPTVNMEALACGTPVLTFQTGGSPEIIDDSCGSVVDCNDIDSMVREIERICTEVPYTTENCLLRAQSFDMNDRFKEYVKLYEDCTYSTKLTI